jgi:hypothetical protein
MPHDALIRSTVSSSDPRAQGLYIRSGMRPRWPNFALLAKGAPFDPPGDVELEQADPRDPDLADMDAALCGRRRPEDLAFLSEGFDGGPHWLRRRGDRIGYGYVRYEKADAFRRPGEGIVGPLGVLDASDSVDAILAASALAASRAPAVQIMLPGPHPALEPLLTSGFRIWYADLFLCSGNAEVFDPSRYVPSGGDLL